MVALRSLISIVCFALVGAMQMSARQRSLSVDGDPVTWDLLANSFCSAAWGASQPTGAFGQRTNEPLESCKAKCASSSDCTAITVGTNEFGTDNCVICIISTETMAAPEGISWNTYIKHRLVPSDVEAPQPAEDPKPADVPQPAEAEAGHAPDELEPKPKPVLGNGVVCLSIPVYEDPPWIQALIQNVQKFMPPSTKIALHLNNFTKNYTTDFISSLEQDRVTVASERWNVGRFKGGIMLAHISNIKALKTRWPGQCDYLMTHASNQMFVRGGVEKVVYDYRYSGIGTPFRTYAECLFKPGFYQLLQKPRGLNGTSGAEGAFYPMSTATNFVRLFDQWTAESHYDLFELTKPYCYMEESWLQTYAVNYENQTGDIGPRRGTVSKAGTCYRSIGDMAKNPKVPTDIVKKVMQGDHSLTADILHEYAQYYSVKRVIRDMKDETTRMIINLPKP
jgi:hypothetical protein